MLSGDEADGESELSEVPHSPVRQKRAPAQSTSHPHPKDIPDPVTSLHPAVGPNFGSKHTLYGSLGSHVPGPLNMVTTSASPVSDFVFSCNYMLTTFPCQMVAEPFSFKYFSLDPTSEAKTYDFVTHESVVSQLTFFHYTI
jgi:hypothetical protein